MQIYEIIFAAITALGGWEAIKYMLNRKTNKRKEEAEADSIEFGVLRETSVFLQKQLADKEHRFAEQTEIVRQLNVEVLELTKRNAKLELDLQRERYIKEHCPNREPKNGF